MEIKQVLAGVAVDDTEAAVAWYERLFGRRADARPMDGLIEWHEGSAGVVQLVADAERAGGSLLSLVTTDARQMLTELAERGLEVGALDETTSDKVLFAEFTDPSGNLVTVVEQR